MRRWIIAAAVVGFLIPVWCGFFQMLLFTAKDVPPWLDFVYWRLPYIICPPWALGDGRAFWMIGIPVLNSILYAAIVYALLGLRARVR